ncbi:MAG: hypothetical protein AAB870_04445 [Patescibacteria group bacterium]
MFDFIEEPIAEEKKQSNTSTTSAPLEGTVYTMPSHRAAVPTAAAISENKKKSGGLIAILVGVGVIVVATVFLVWWVVFPPITSTTPPIAQQPTETNETPTTPVNENPPVNPPSEPTPIPSDTTPTTPPSTITYTKSADSDSDDLTDTEERIFNTDDQKPDTDADGFLDGAEVKFLYDPTKTGTKLDQSSTVTLYKNTNYVYSLLYPSAWVVDSVDKGNKEVIFSSATGEFLNLTVQDNPEKLSALEWYTTVHKPNANTASLQTMKYDTWTGVMSENGLEVYMTANDDSGTVISPYVYVLTYDLGGKQEMNFGSVFQMMIRSFLITDLSSPR